jgi:UPF0755 protein
MIFGRRKDAPVAASGTSPEPSPLRLSPRSASEALKPTAAPPPPSRRRRKKPRSGWVSALSGFLSLAAVAAIVVMFGVLFLERQAGEPGPLPADKVVLVPKNTGTSEIATLLAREGVIRHPSLFELHAFMNRHRGQLKAGEFLFKARASLEEAVDTLIQGKPILHTLTVPEGLTSEQIMARLNENEILTGEVSEVPREGSLMPDTYKFERGMTRQQLVNLMQAKQREATTQIWSRRSPDLPIKTPQELVILASVIEKETGRGDERARVASVFVNRLSKRMKLQSDPTIVYGLVGGKGTLGRGILRSEIEKPTPYNTYAIEGLPPGPIANPGRAALEAAANPSKTKDLYFVADGTGGHAFAENYEQHQRNVGRWRQVERSKAGGEAAPVDRVEPPPAPEAGAPGAPALQPSAFTQSPAITGAPFPAAGRPGPDAAAGARGQRGRAFDAVEGTNRDPLRNRTYDLNSSKTVPNLRP